MQHKFPYLNPERRSCWAEPPHRLRFSFRPAANAAVGVAETEVEGVVEAAVGVEVAQ
jgi:hypothetical protein